MSSPRLTRWSLSASRWAASSSASSLRRRLSLSPIQPAPSRIGWAFERLARHPEVMSAAQRAAREDDDAYLDAVVKETLRSRPVIPDVARLAVQPISLAGYELPAGITVMPSIGLVQDGDAFADAEAFRPRAISR